MAGARPPDAAAARRFCALPRDLQGSAGRTREGPCGGCGRAGGSAGANGHGPPPMAAFAAARAQARAFASFLCTIAAGVRSSGRGRARRRDGLALPHPTSPGRAFASFLCTIAAGVRSSGRGRARRRDGLALPHPTSHGRAFAAFLCTAAAACAVPAAAVRGGGTGWRFPTPHPMAARSRRSCARPPRRAQFRPRPCAAEGRAGASPPHIPRPRVRSVPVHGRRGVRSSGRGRARRRDGLALPHPTSHGRAFASFLCTIAAGVRRRRDGPALLHPTSHGRAFAALKFIPCAGRICAYSRCAAAASASAQSVRSQGRSRSARPKWP